MAEPLPRAVLIIDESDPSSGAPTTFSATLRKTLSNVTPNVAVFGETVDLSQFEDPWQQAILRTYVQQKYNDVRFGVVVAVGEIVVGVEGAAVSLGTSVVISVGGTASRAAQAASKRVRAMRVIFGFIYPVL